MIVFQKLDRQPYEVTWEKMKSFTASRDNDTEDEVWLLEHDAVYTQGQAGKAEHILASSSIPIVQSDRGGQVTYHGPGQLVAYVMLDLIRLNIGIRTLVCKLEQILIDLLADYTISAQRKPGAPGVYVGEKKIASIGLRVKKGCTYHGIALNVDMDLKPFQSINPCGYQALKMTQMKYFCPNICIEEVQQRFLEHFTKTYQNLSHQTCLPR